MDKNSRSPVRRNPGILGKTEQIKFLSKKLIKRVSERTRHIAESPLIYKAAEFKDTRVASLGNFSIFYKTSDEQIIITAFWDNRQDPEKLLEILKNKK